MPFRAVPSSSRSNPKRYRPASDECRSFNVGCLDDLLAKVELIEAALGAHAAVWTPGCSLVPIPGETDLWERCGRRVEISLQDLTALAKEYIADEMRGFFRALNQSPDMPGASAITSCRLIYTRRTYRSQRSVSPGIRTRLHPGVQTAACAPSAASISSTFANKSSEHPTLNDRHSSEAGRYRFGLLLLLEGTARKGIHSKMAQRDMIQSETSASME
jgi:hypothetical protein